MEIQHKTGYRTRI